MTVLVEVDSIPNVGMHLVAKQRSLRLRDPVDGIMKTISVSRPRLFRNPAFGGDDVCILSEKQAKERFARIGEGDQALIPRAQDILRRVEVCVAHAEATGTFHGLRDKLAHCQRELAWFIELPTRDCVAEILDAGERVLKQIEPTMTGERTPAALFDARQRLQTLQATMAEHQGKAAALEEEAEAAEARARTAEKLPALDAEPYAESAAQCRRKARASRKAAAETQSEIETVRERAMSLPTSPLDEIAAEVFGVPVDALELDQRGIRFNENEWMLEVFDNTFHELALPTAQQARIVEEVAREKEADDRADADGDYDMDLLS